MKKYIILLATCLFIAFACNKIKLFNEINSHLGQEIKIPNGLKCAIQSNSANKYDLLNKNIKLVSYIDSIDCESCALGVLWHWTPVIDSMQSVDIPVIFILHTNKKESVGAYLKEIKFNYPVFYDKSGMFGKLNKIGKDKKFHTFLLDDENKIRAIGLLLYNDKLKVFYNETITKIKSEIKEKEEIDIAAIQVQSL